MNLYRGPFLEGLGIPSDAFEDWARSERTRLADLALRAGHALLARDPEEAGDLAARLLGIDPYDEVALRALMQDHLRRDRPARALELYEAARNRLRDELAAEPAPETRALAARIRAHGPETTAEPGGPPTSEHPAPRDETAEPPGVGALGWDHRRLLWGAVAIGFLLVPAALFFWRGPGNAPSSGGPVLLLAPPVAEAGATPDLLRAGGFVEDLSAALTRVPGVRILSSETARSRPRWDATAARAAGASHLLVMRLDRRADGILLDMRLLDLRDDTEMVALRRHVSAQALSGFRDRLLEEVVLGLGAQFAGPQRMPDRPTQVAEAYDDWLLGLAAQKSGGATGAARALARFEAAVRADPGFSKARAGQAELFFAAAFVSQDYAEALQINWLDAYEAMKLRLATLPDDLPAVTVLEARLALRRYDLDAAVELARMAMRAAPGDAETHLVLAEVLAFHGEAEGALEAARTALALNPGRPSAALAAQGLAHFAGGDLLAARDAMEAAVGAAEVPPARDLALLAAVQALAGANEEARATLDRYVAALEDRPRRLWRLAEALPANPRAMTWMRPGLAEAMATFPFREARVVDRLAQGLVAAGIARAGLGYYRLDARLRLDGNDVQALVFGREIAGRGAPEPFSAWRQTRTQEGALFQPSRFGPTILGREGRSAVVGDALCDAWRAGDTDLTSCGLIFRIDDTIPLPGAYVVTTELRVFAFDPG